MARGHIRPARSAAGRDGRAWQVVVELPPDGAGVRRQRWVTVPGTRRDAERALTRLQHDADTGKGLGGQQETVGQYLTGWLEDCAKLELAPQSYLAYSVAVRYWCGRLGAVRLARLTVQQVQAACRAMSDAGLAPATVRRHHGVLHRALKQAVEWGLIGRNPADGITLPRRERSAGRVLAPQECVRLLAAAHQDPDGLAVVLALGLGLRAGEILGLRWQDVDLEARVAHIRQAMQQSLRTTKAPKSGKARKVAIPTFVAVALREALARDEAERERLGPGWNPERLVKTGREGGYVALHTPQVMRRICAAAGLPYMRLHDLRHTYASLLLADGESVRDVSEALGHSTPMITLNVYAHHIKGAEGRLAARMDAILEEQ